MSAVFDPQGNSSGQLAEKLVSDNIDSQVRGMAMKVVADVGASSTPMNLLNRFLGGVFSLAPKKPDERLQSIFVNAVLKAYDELIMPIDIEKIPNFVEGILKRAARTVLREALDAFFADDKHAEVGGGIGDVGKSTSPPAGNPSPVSPVAANPSPVNPSPSFPPPPGFGG
jgi:hypothetical protein